MRTGRIVTIVLLALAVVLLVPAVWGIARVNDGLEVSKLTVESVPVTVMHGSTDADPRPGVVVAHGFAASSVIMEPLGRMLAKAGYTVAFPDLSGHGANSSRLVIDDTVRDELQQDLAAVVDWLRVQPNVDGDRIALVGHSMGAGAVTRFAIERPDDVIATVAISLPSAIDPVNDPRNLLMLYGSAEPAGFAEAAREQLEWIRPGSEIDVSYGSLAEGTAIEVEQIPGVEHISIVWSPTTAQSTVAWIGGATGGPTGPVDLDPAWLWLLLILIAACILAIPLTRWLYGPATAPPETRVPGWVAISITAAAAVGASVTAAVLGDLADSVIPLAVGGYLAVWFATAAAVIAIALLLVRRYRRRDYGPFVPRWLIASLLMTSYLVIVLIVSARFTWATAAFVGPRWWIWLVLSLVFLGYFYADSVLISRPSLGGRVGLLILHRLIIVVALLTSVFVLGAPGILTLLLPFMVLLFVILGFVALVVSTRTPSRFGPALVQAVPLAAVVATGFPLVSG